MFIQTEPTPNPATMKFIPGCEVMPKGAVADFPTAEDAARSPLARALFATGAVTRVFFGTDFISVTKKEGAWKHLKPVVLEAIMEHFAGGGALIDHPAEEPAAEDAEDSEILAQIKELIETRVRPALARDGGDVAYKGFDEIAGVVYLHMRGACSGCPSATQTLKQGIEALLRHYVPEVNAVEAV
jgi:Fe-S cluster biogenesis protein NfuA